MSFRKWALIAGVAVTCAGCVTETKTVDISSENVSKLKNLKETEYAKQLPKASTFIAIGQMKEAAAADSAAPLQQEKLRDEARQAYQKAIEIDPHCIQAHLALGAWYRHQDDDARALAAYQAALKQNPKAAPLWYEQGVIYCGRKDFTNALTCLKQAHELEPDNKSLASQYGFCLARAGKPQEAVVVFSRVMSKADANYQVARMMDHCKQPEQCRQYLTVALQERPSHTGAQQLWAQINAAPLTQAPAVASSQCLDPDVRQAASFEDPQ
jgi:tetratricopeptide (TPR) repeat protein